MFWSDVTCVFVLCVLIAMRLEILERERDRETESRGESEGPALHRNMTIRITRQVQIKSQRCIG